MNDYKVVDITGMNIAALETELNNEAISGYFFKTAFVVASSTFAVFSVKSIK